MEQGQEINIHMRLYDYEYYMSYSRTIKRNCFGVCRKMVGVNNEIQ